MKVRADDLDLDPAIDAAEHNKDLDPLIKAPHVAGWRDLSTILGAAGTDAGHTGQ